MAGFLWRYSRRYLANDRGVALIVVLFVVALVTVLVLEYHYDAAVELELAANYGEDVQAYHLAMSGLSFARAILLLDDDAQVDGAQDTWHQLSSLPTCFSPQQLLALAGAEEGGLLGVGDNQAELAATSEPAKDDQACVSLRIIDESGKLPLNALVSEDDDLSVSWVAIFDKFFELFEIEADLRLAVVDWLDDDDNPQPIFGAEKNYYEGLETPYEPRNGPILTPGELRLIRGFDADTLVKLFPGLEPKAVADVDLGTNIYLTLFGDSQASPLKVNLNTADELVLQALLAGLQVNSPEDVARDIVRERTEREDGQFNTIDEVESLTNIGLRSNVLEQVAGVASTHFRVESIGVIGPIQKRVIAVLHRANTLEMTYFKVE